MALSSHPSPTGQQGPPTGVRAIATRSLFIRFLLRIFLPLLCAALLFMLVFSHYTWKDITSDIDSDVDAYATSLVRVLDDLMWNFQTEELVSALATLSSNPAMLGAEIYDTENKLFLEYGVVPGKGEVDLMSIRKPIFKRKPDGERVDLGTYVLHYNYAHADEQFRQYLNSQILRLGIIVLVIIISGAYAYQEVMGRPLRKLLKAIRATEDVAVPMPVNWKSSDEMGEVIAAHNSMIRRLSEKEVALAESEQRYRHLFNSAMVGIYQMRPDGTFKDSNQTLANLLGYNTPEDMRKVNVIEHYINEGDRTILWETLQRDGEISHFEVNLKRVDGRSIWVELSGKLNEENALNGIIMDVTAQMEARRALEERDELHRAFFEENKAVMLLHDPQDSSIQFVNPAACQFYGYTAEEMTRMSIRDLDCMTEEDMLQEFRASTMERRNYFKHVHKLSDGSHRDVEVYTGPVSLADRQLHYSIVQDVTEKRRLVTKLERMATRDQLTGAYNRHAFFSMAKNEIQRSERFDHPMTVLMFDLDHFKRVNDTHGHAVGDEVLRGFALRCRATLRKIDIFARLGGEEFAAVLIETDEKGGMNVAERIRETAATKPAPTDAGELIVTVSIGMASLKEGENVAQVLKRADDALYEAKKDGRNIVRKA